MLESKVANAFGMDKAVQINEREHFEQEAKVALALIERWGMVAAVDHGEDSAGRARLRLSTPQELVERAFTVARIAMSTARSLNLVHTIPSIEDVEVAHQAAEQERNEKRKSH